MNSIVANMLSNLSSEELRQIKALATAILRSRTAGRVDRDLASASGYQKGIQSKLPDKLAPKLPDKILPDKISDPKLLDKFTPPKLLDKLPMPSKLLDKLPLPKLFE